MSIQLKSWQLFLHKRGSSVFLLVAVLAGLTAFPVRAYSGGYAVGFDGVDDRALISYAGIMGSDPTCRQTKSLSVWVRPLGASPESFMPNGLDYIAGTAAEFWGITRGYSTYFSRDALWVYNNDEDGNMVNNFIPIPYQVGEWAHITLVHSGGYLSAFKNGVLIQMIPSGNTISAWSDCGYLSIGGSYLTYFEGQVDEVGFWTVALTAANIRQITLHELTGSEPGLAAYYQMSNGSGSSVTDDSGHGYPATLYGSPAWPTSGALAGPRNALAFDGTDDYVSISDDNRLDLTSSMTFEAWIYPANWNNSSNTPLAVKGDGVTPEINYYFGKSATGDLMFAHYCRGGLRTVVDTSSISYSNSTWYHLAIVVDPVNNQVRFYRNGLLLSAVSQDFTTYPLTANNQSLTLARFLNSSDAAFEGRLDEVRIWNIARTQKQIRDDMFQTLRGDEAGLVAYYRFDQSRSVDQTTLYNLTAPYQLDGALTSFDATTAWVTPTLPSAFNTWIGSDSTAWDAAGNWSLNAVPTNNDNVGVYTYPGGNNPFINSGVSASVKNLLVTSEAALNVANGAALSVADRLLNNGQISQTQPVSGSTDSSFLATGSYGGLLINPNGADLGVTTVTIRGNQDCTNAPGDTVQRCFNITPGNANQVSARLTFFFDTDELSGNLCSSLNGYQHVSGSTWSLLTLDSTYGSGGHDCAAEPLAVRITGVTSFTPNLFVLNQDAPTAITLVSFSGVTQTGQLVLSVALAVSALALSFTYWLRKRRRMG